MSFEKKKIQLETLGEYLCEVRIQLNMSLEEAARKTGIKLKFLQSLEQSQFAALPPDVYVFGFLRQIAALYSSEADVLIAQYKKERAVQKMLDKPTVPAWKNRYLNKLVVTPKLVGMGLGILFVVLTLGYVILQVLSINKTPFLEITEPHNGQIITGSAVMITGKTVPGTIVSINNQNIFVDGTGNFKTQIGIAAGDNSLKITASNKFGKSVSKNLSVAGQAPFTIQGSQVALQLMFTGEVSLDVAIDGGPSQSVKFHAGDNKTFIAQNKLVISTSDAGATKAILGNQNLGFLGRSGERLVNVEFLAQSDTMNPSHQ